MRAGRRARHCPKGLPLTKRLHRNDPLAVLALEFRDDLLLRVKRGFSVLERKVEVLDLRLLIDAWITLVLILKLRQLLLDGSLGRALGVQ